MARVTIEDCLAKVENHFELVLLATKRARELDQGKDPKVEWENDKATVVALREIAGDHIAFDHYQKKSEPIEFAEKVTEEETTEMSAVGEALTEESTAEE